MLTRVRVRVRVCLHELAKFAPYCKHCYSMWMLHYVCHNNDVIIDVKTFWRRFLLFSYRKRGTVHVNCLFQGNSYRTRTLDRVEIVWWGSCSVLCVGCWMSDLQLVDLQLPNRITTTDIGLQFISSKWRHVLQHLDHIDLIGWDLCWCSCTKSVNH